MHFPWAKITTISKTHLCSPMLFSYTYRFTRSRSFCILRLGMKFYYINLWILGCSLPRKNLILLRDFLKVFSSLPKGLVFSSHVQEILVYFCVICQLRMESCY